jgi:energy-coupling factor transporter transmembrane protein EcfT
MKISFIHLLLIFIIVIFVIITNVNTNNSPMVLVKSDMDNKEYMVRDEDDKIKAANTLSIIHNNLKLLVNYLDINKEKQGFSENKEYINRMINQVDYIILDESKKNSGHTSYSVNKGEKIIFCMRSMKTNDIHDINLMMYVALHELAHVACPIYDNHGPLFKKIFTFITKNAVDIGVYTKIDFDNYPMEYCGMKIDASII